MKFTNIQIMRAVAAWLVVVDHSLLLSASWWSVDVSPLARTLGAAGVYVFFAISGFIMAVTTWERWGSPTEAGKFWLRRAERVIPLYWLFTLAFFAKAGGVLDQLLKSLAFIPYHDGDKLRPIIARGWTLDYEAFFYLLFGACLLLPRRLGLPVAVALLTGLGLGGLILRLAHGPVGPLLEVWAGPLLLLFVGGIAAGVARLNRPERLGPALLLASVLIALGVALAMMTGFREPDDLVQRGADILPNALLGLCAIASVATAAFAVREAEGRLGGMLEVAGNASYSTYLVHPFAILAVKKVWSAAHLPHILPAFLAIAFVVATAAGLVVHYLVERSIIRAFREKSLLALWKRDRALA